MIRKIKLIGLNIFNNILYKLFCRDCDDLSEMSDEEVEHELKVLLGKDYNRIFGKDSMKSFEY